MWPTAGRARSWLERIGDYDGILIRSATKLDAELIDAASRLRAVGRAGVGVDNVDVAAATKRGIVVANAPQSNVITAAEHTMALLLALARNIPQAHASLTGGAWERSKFSGVELHEKMLGILGFGRIGQLVAQRARGFGMHVIAFDPFVSAERYRELGVEKAESPDDVYAVADFLTLHLPNTPDTAGLAERGGAGQVQGRGSGPERGARPARGRGGPQGGPRLRKGGGRGARRVRRRARDRASAVRLPERDRHPPPGSLDGRGHRPGRLSGRRAGDRRADRRGGHQRGQRPGDPARGHGGAGAVRAAVPGAGADRGRARRRAPRSTASRSSSWAGSPSTTPACWPSRCCSACSRGHTEEEVGVVNAPAMAEERGIELVETKRTGARDYTDLVRVTVPSGELSRAGRRDADRPPQPAPPAGGLGAALRRPARGARDAVPLPRHARDDRPGGDDLRRPRHQHRLGRRGPPAGGRRRGRAGWPRW